MAHRHPPMPALFGNVQEDTRAIEDENASIDYYESEETCASSETTIQTCTTTITHHIQWTIDGRTLEIACMAPKADTKGVVSAFVERNGHEFKLELCASGWRNSQDGFAAFYLTVTDDGEHFVARYRVHAENVSRTSSIRYDFQLGVGFPSFCEQSLLTGVGSDQEITFYVTVEEFQRNSHIENRRSGKITPEERLRFLSNAMHNIYQNRLHADVTLVCQGHRIPAHKAVLASCSPVFRAMFEHPFLERSNEVVLGDFSPQTVRSMIRFLYTGELSHADDDECQVESECLTEELLDGDSSDEDMMKGTQTQPPSEPEKEENVPPPSAITSKDEATLCDTSENALDMVNDVDMHFFNLFRFAEMYEMKSLVIACCRKMHESICVSNICKLMIPLSRYTHIEEFDGLQDSLWKFFKKNYHEIKKTAGFRILLQRHPSVVCDLLKNLSFS